jgi:hypothetical protein
MRSLTLNQKISIKGELHRRGVPARVLVDLKTAYACYLYYRIFGRSIATYNTK